MNTWILLLLWTALVAWLGYRYAEPAIQLLDRAVDSVADLVRKVRP